MAIEREAITMATLPCEGEQICYRVGFGYSRFIEGQYRLAGTVTRIVVTDDLPGLHGNMERVKVYDGDSLIFEAPLHCIEGVEYAPPPSAEGA